MQTVIIQYELFEMVPIEGTSGFTLRRLMSKEVVNALQNEGNWQETPEDIRLFSLDMLKQANEEAERLMYYGE